MFRNLRVFMFILFGICSIPNICIAQDVQTIINSATQDFESGQFGEAKQQVFQCFSGRKFDNIKLTNDAYRLLSLISNCAATENLGARQKRRNSHFCSFAHSCS